MHSNMTLYPCISECKHKHVAILTLSHSAYTKFKGKTYPSAKREREGESKNFSAISVRNKLNHVHKINSKIFTQCKGFGY